MPDTIWVYPAPAAHGAAGAFLFVPQGSASAGIAPARIAREAWTVSRIFSVRELTEAVKRTLEGAYPFVWVKGQVSNLTRAASGHVYFSLKDADATLGCVWFRTAQRGEEHFDPLTGEVYENGPKPSLSQTMREGMEIMCAGRLNVYPPRGSYQLVVEIAQEAGLGQLYLQFEELKRQLAAKGYFDQDRKRPLPYHPARVAVITAPTGAAVRDFVRIAQGRGYGAAIRVYPSLVQGDDAPEQIAAALDAANAHDWADVVVLARGGGSIEDLWAFNDVRIAEAIYRSALPVVSGVGHEVDVTIADLVADVRAATPSHAAQLLWPERAVLMQRVDEAQMRLDRHWQSLFREQWQQVDALSRGLVWLSPANRLQRLEEQCADTVRHLQRTMALRLDAAEGVVQQSAERILRGFGPQLDSLQQRCGAVLERLQWAAERTLHRREAEFGRMEAQFAALDPMRPLERGYSLVRREDGSFLRSISETVPGDALAVTVRDGIVHTQVTDTEPKQNGEG